MKLKQIIKITLTSLIAALACTGIIYAATTVGNNITTGGTLTVTGANTFYGATTIGGALTATSTLSVTGLTTLGNASSTLLSVSGTAYIGGSNGLILTDGSITDASGAISFGDENLTTTGNLTIIGSTTLEDLIIDVTNAEAFLVRKNSDGGDVFTVDTSNSDVTITDSDDNSAATLQVTSTNENMTTGRVIFDATYDGNPTALSSKKLRGMVINSSYIPTANATSDKVKGLSSNNVFGTVTLGDNAWNAGIGTGVRIQHIGSYFNSTSGIYTGDWKGLDITDEGWVVSGGGNFNTGKTYTGLNIHTNQFAPPRLEGIHLQELTTGTVDNINLTVQGTSGGSGENIAILVDADMVEALLVRKDGDSGDVFTVDTTNSLTTGAINSGGTFTVCASDRESTRWKCDWTCDGTADDEQIQLAVDACTSGCTIILTEGNYDIASPITMALDGITFKGQGIKATFLNNTQNDDMFQWVKDTSGTLGFLNFMHFAADGNGVDAGVPDGCEWPGGSQTSGSFFDARPPQTCGAGSDECGTVIDVLMFDIFAYDFPSHAVITSNGWGWKITDSIFEYNDGDGFRVESGGSCPKFTGNKIIANTGGGIYVTGTSACQVIGNELGGGETNTDAALFFAGNSSANMVLGNSFVATTGCTGDTSPPNYFETSPSALNHQITGNRFASSGLIDYAVEIENGTIVTNNYMGSGFVSGVFEDNSTGGARVHDNTGYINRRSALLSVECVSNTFANQSGCASAGVDPDCDANTVTVNHSMDVTPTAIWASVRGGVVAAGDRPLAIGSTIDATDFTISLENATCTDGWYTFMWEATAEIE